MAEREWAKKTALSWSIRDVAETHDNLNLLEDVNSENYLLVKTRIDARLFTLKQTLQLCEDQDFCRDYGIDGYKEAREKLNNYEF